MNFSQFTNKTIEEVLAELKTSNGGLSKKEVLLRQKTFGLNEIKEKKISVFEIFLRQVRSPFFYLLLIAAFIAFLIGERVDSITILFFIFLNVLIGFFQEYKAERAIFLLKKFIPHRVRVLRENREEIIDKKYLVPGDIVLLEAGDTAPADLRILSLQNFLVEESVLTGESASVFKISDKLSYEEKEIFNAKNIIFSGTSVMSGKAKTVVLATGKETVFGGIVKTLSDIKRESFYEKNLLDFCRLILKIVVVTILLIFVANILIKGAVNFFKLALFYLALIISILPEALPAVVVFSLANGSLKMAKRHVVIRRLSAIEDLGNIEVLCTDKTGTLTQNKPSLEKIVSSDKNKCLLYSILTIENFLDLKINQKILDPFDLAVTERISEEILRKAQEYKIIFELPFDSYRMMASVLAENQNNKEKFLIVKGAPELVIEKCPQFSGRFTHLEILEDIKREGSEGKRVLAIAYKKITKDQITKDDERDLTFLGYFVFEDPLKATAKEAIELSKKLGVQIKILTGDSKEVAIFTAKKIGLIFNLEKVISGKKLLELNPDDFDNACEEKMVFARVSPDIKHKIIKSLQKKYQVGFLGEGINDAPAIKAANVGIVVAGASEVTRETADVVLLEKDLRVIVNGIKEGRTIFSNINKYIKCALASNFGNFYSIAVISLFINFLPMLPLQILLGNILSDFPLISIANDSVDVEELRKPKMYQLHMVLPLIVSLALVSTVFDFIFFTIFLKQQPAVIQTLWFIESILTEILLIFVVRTRRGFWQAKQPARWLTVFTIIDAIFIVALPFLKIGQNWFHFVALPILPLLIVFFLVAAYFMVSEFVKLAYFRYWKPKNSVVS